MLKVKTRSDDDTLCLVSINKETASLFSTNTPIQILADGNSMPFLSHMDQLIAIDRTHHIARSGSAAIAAGRPALRGAVHISQHSTNYRI